MIPKFLNKVVIHLGKFIEDFFCLTKNIYGLKFVKNLFNKYKMYLIYLMLFIPKISPIHIKRFLRLKCLSFNVPNMPGSRGGELALELRGESYAEHVL